ncbi:MAG: glycosyltransferase 87 family protein [Flavobacteriia bacterium]|jgi:alpha-1,6-mannosyltransferase
MIKRFEERWKFYCSAFLFVISLTALGIIQRENISALFPLYLSSFLGFILVLRTYRTNTEVYILLGLTFLASLFQTPELSNDFNRFLWDGEWLTHGINPYDFRPTQLTQQEVFEVNPHLQKLFDNMGTLSQQNYSCYPPLTQVFFTIAAFLSESSFVGLLVLRLLFIAVVLIALKSSRQLVEKGVLDQNAIWFLFLNPLFIVEVFFNLHFEGIMICLLLISFIHLMESKLISGSILFAAAVHIKLIPLMLLPFFWRFLGWKKALWLYVFVVCGVLLFALALIDQRNYHHFMESLTLYFKVFEFNSFILHYYLQYGYWKLGWNATMFYGPRLARIAIQCITVLALYGEFKSPEVLLKRMTIAYFIYLLLSSTLHPWYILPLLFLSIFTTYLFPLLWSLTVILSYAFYTRGNTASTNEILLWIEYFPVLGLFGYEMMYGGLRNKISLCNQSRFGTGS